MKDTKKHERVHISETELFAISVAIGAGAIAYKVAEKVFPVLVEKAGSIITGLLGK